MLTMGESATLSPVVSTSAGLEDKVKEGEGMLIRIKSTNDINGNPRRGWLRVDAGGSVRSWIEEGYEGEGAISAYKGEAETLPIYVTPKEYNRLRKGSGK